MHIRTNGPALRLQDYHLPLHTQGSWSELLRRYGPDGLAAYLKDLRNLRHPPAEALDPDAEITPCDNPILWGPATVGHLTHVGTSPAHEMPHQAA